MQNVVYVFHELPELKSKPSFNHPFINSYKVDFSMCFGLLMMISMSFGSEMMMFSSGPSHTLQNGSYLSNIVTPNSKFSVEIGKLLQFPEIIE